MAKTATLVRADLDGFNGAASLYRLSEPVDYDMDWDTDEYTKSTSFVIVSAANVMFSGVETYIFPADEEGNIVDWGELDGSYRGGMSHETALRGAGYEVVTVAA